MPELWYNSSTIKFPQISSEALSQSNSLMGFKVICQLEKEPLKGIANVQEVLSYTISLANNRGVKKICTHCLVLLF